MLRFGAERSTGGLVSENAISWALSTLKSMQMTRLVMITAALFVGLAALGAVVMATHKSESAQSSRSVTTAARDREPEKRIVPTRKAELTTVRVVNQKGEGVPNVAVLVFESTLSSELARISNQCRRPVPSAR